MSSNISKNQALFLGGALLKAVRREQSALIGGGVDGRNKNTLQKNLPELRPRIHGREFEKKVL